jgi:hypothetical protein
VLTTRKILAIVFWGPGALKDFMSPNLDWPPNPKALSGSSDDGCGFVLKFWFWSGHQFLLAQPNLERNLCPWLGLETITLVAVLSVPLSDLTCTQRHIFQSISGSVHSLKPKSTIPRAHHLQLNLVPHHLVLMVRTTTLLPRESH